MSLNRLGEAEKALEHYEKSGPKVDRRDISEAQNLKRMIHSCIEAHSVKDYVTLLHMSENALSSGADSAPQVETALSIILSSSLISALRIYQYLPFV